MTTTTYIRNRTISGVINNRMKKPKAEIFINIEERVDGEVHQRRKTFVDFAEANHWLLQQAARINKRDDL